MLQIQYTWLYTVESSLCSGVQDSASSIPLGSLRCAERQPLQCRAVSENVQLMRLSVHVVTRNLRKHAAVYRLHMMCNALSDCMSKAG